jgi:hypothetical protein
MRFLTTLLTGLILLGVSTATAQTAQDVTIRDLNTYPTALTSPSQVNTHPLTGQLVKFTAVIISYPKNSGLASYTAASNSIGRIHTFVVDTNALAQGLDGQYMQLVAPGATLTVLEELNRGDIITVEGQLTFFASGQGWVSQFDPSSIVLVGSANTDAEFEKFLPLLEPTVVTPADLNVKNPDGTFSYRMDNYTTYINRYVRIENTRVINRLVANTGRPWMYVGDDVSTILTTDTSLRLRNDRSAYRVGYNNRRTEDGAYAPPPPGSVVNLSGFIVMNNFNVDGRGADNYKIVPWDDGVVWVPGEAEGTFVRVTPEGWPNDLQVVGFPPEFANFTISTQTPTSAQQVTVSVDITAPQEGTSVTSATITYTPRGGEPVTADLTKGAGNTYTFTFPTFANLMSVSFAINASDNNGITGRFTSAQTSFIVLDNAITTIRFINETGDGARGPSPLAGLGVLPMNITATVMSDSADGFILIHDSNGPWSGIALNTNATTRKLLRGDIITITAAAVIRQFDVNYLTNLTYTVSEEGNTDMDSMMPLLETGVFGTGNRGAEYIGMMVRFENVALASKNADAPTGNFGEWSFATSGQSAVRVDDRFQVTGVEIRTNFPSSFNRNLADDVAFSSLRGGLYWSFGNPKLAIRQRADLVTVGDNLTVPNRVITLLSPADNATYNGTTGTTVEWDNTSSDFDGDAVRYLWAITTKPETGSPDFGTSLAVVPADNNGASGTLTLPQEAIETVMTAVGMAQNETKAFAWTVWLTDGKDTVQTSTFANTTGFTPVFRTLNLTKLTGTSVDDPSGLPSEFALEQNYPNPFNPSTQIRFALPIDSKVRLTVYDMLGREVAVLVDDVRPAGRHAVSLDAARLASGIYLYRLEAGTTTFTRKMTLIK